VNLTQRSTGEMLAAIRAEARNPRGDVWWGGTGDPHVAAGEEGLTQAHESPRIAELHDWAQAQWRETQGRTVGVYASVLGFGFNTELIARRNLPEPRCWADLLDPRYRGEIQMANPNSSGTAYIVIATLVQMMGEEPAFEYLSACTAASTPTRAAAPPDHRGGARRDRALHLLRAQRGGGARGGLPGRPCRALRGHGYEIGSMSILRGARNMSNAQRFYHWALSAEAQLDGEPEARSCRPWRTATCL
jgi:iron(III) transport system substrate-binding protein